MDIDQITVSGARQHNLQNVSLTVPKRSLVVFTGPSGSGKSSLAFDTLYAEGQRHYVESMSVYARMFLGQLEKPDVDEIRGLSPAISVDQRTVTPNPRSTVGTVTEVLDYLRILFARVGRQHCHGCGNPVGATDPDRILREILSLPDGTRFLVMAPLVRNRKGEFRELFQSLRTRGFQFVRIDGERRELESVARLDKNVRHTIDLVVDRLIAGRRDDARMREAVNVALREGDAALVLRIESGPDAGSQRTFSTRSHCSDCGLSFPPLSSQSFSFNSPLGRCPECLGIGRSLRFSPELLVPDPELSIRSGAIRPLQIRSLPRASREIRELASFCSRSRIPIDLPWSRLTPDQQRTVLEGSDPDTREHNGLHPRLTESLDYPGVIERLTLIRRDSGSAAIGEKLAPFCSEQPCPNCNGSRLRPESRAVRVGGLALTELCELPISDATRRLAGVVFEGSDLRIGRDLVAESLSRLRFLDQVGVGYLSLSRGADTLSGGEAQRIRLASQLGSGLTGVLYVLDEPSIGLHQRDNRALLSSLAALRDGGNSVVVVEHDRETMEAADWIVDFGPGAGVNGGRVTFSGRPADLLSAVGNVTADYLANRREIPLPPKRRAPERGAIRIRDARANNLRGFDAEIPIGTFTCITGVSGAGKSTLVHNILLPSARNRFTEEKEPVGRCGGVEGVEAFDKVIEIDQRPIGRTPRSNPATYTGLFDEIRAWFAGMPESLMYGYAPGRFSFNVAGGRCEACEGAGVRRIEMRFLADTFVTCDACEGRRFNDATLRVRWRDRNIADVLAMDVDAAISLFETVPQILRPLGTLSDVGLGYLALGQPSPTLSGGESQRIKLARELARRATGSTLYVLDEPSTGLHFDDIARLLQVVQRLVDAGNTVVMIEHNIEIIRTADYVIDIGPEGGAGGGEIVAFGTPEQVASCERSWTGTFLRRTLTPDPTPPGPIAGRVTARRAVVRKTRRAESDAGA